MFSRPRSAGYQSSDYVFKAHAKKAQLIKLSRCYTTLSQKPSSNCSEVFRQKYIGLEKASNCNCIAAIVRDLHSSSLGEKSSKRKHGVQIATEAASRVVRRGQAEYLENGGIWLAVCLNLPSVGV